VIAIGLQSEEYGIHSLRRTKPPVIYKRSANLCAVRILRGHIRIETTVRFHGVSKEDDLALEEAAET
jgi:hypothetical protein